MKWKIVVPAELRTKSDWPLIEYEHRLPCPKCQSMDLEVFANVVECLDCEHSGPKQDGPEFACDWRQAIVDWNNAAEDVNQ